MNVAFFRCIPFLFALKGKGLWRLKKIVFYACSWGKFVDGGEDKFKWVICFILNKELKIYNLGSILDLPCTFLIEIKWIF